MFVPDKTRTVVVRAVEEGSKCRAFAEMQGQCTRCRRALGRTREGKKSSSWCWLQLFSAARLVDQWAPLPAFCCAGWLTRPSGHDSHWTTGRPPEHWLRRGIPGPSERARASKVWACRRGSLAPTLGSTYAAHSVAFSLYLWLRPSIVEERDRRKTCSANSSCNCKGDCCERSCATCRYGDVDCWFANGVERTGPPEYPQFGGCSRSFGDDRGGWKKMILPTLLATRPPWTCPRLSQLSALRSCSTSRLPYRGVLQCSIWTLPYLARPSSTNM
jgi:hypothetical protein